MSAKIVSLSSSKPNGNPKPISSSVSALTHPVKKSNSTPTLSIPPKSKEPSVSKLTVVSTSSKTSVRIKPFVTRCCELSFDTGAKCQYIRYCWLFRKRRF